MAGWTTAYLSIGSNRGDTVTNLDTAIQALRADADIRVIAESDRYKTAPQDFQDQEWFLNAALEITTRLEALPLLQRLKRIEKKLDAEGKAFRFGPRIIDLDIVLYDDLVLKTPEIEIPHPRMHERCFVLQPLCDIDGTLCHPVLNKTIRDLLEEINTLEDQGVIALDQEA
jgi:2-amino-4-hydroxy-6-hydroxymethyldihydropteridine diphosphokinase